MKSLEYLLPLLIMLAAATRDPTPPDNRLENPGFEETVGNEPVAWQKVIDPDTRNCEIGVTRQGARSGKHA
ncbi:MAG: hypothetical protein EHM18_18395, partial [Acidobacteria bacterium]